MTIRFRAVPVAAVALVCGVGLASAGCGRYSWNTLSAVKSFKDGNLAYQQKDWKKAAEKYEEVVQHEGAFANFPQLATAYFFLGNSYDQLYKPTKQGDATNDAYIQKAIANYRKGADKNADKQWKKSCLEYLAAAYGSDKLNDPAKAEPVYQEIIALEPNEPQNYIALGKLYEDAGRYDEAEAQFKKAIDTRPNDAGLYAVLAGYYDRQGQFEKTMEAWTMRAKQEPNNPEAWQTIATYYQDEAFRDKRLPPAKAKEYVLAGLEATDKALALNPNYFEALTYKNILLRQQATYEKDPKKQKELLDQAEQYYKKATEAQKTQKGK